MPTMAAINEKKKQEFILKTFWIKILLIPISNYTLKEIDNRIKCVIYFYPEICRFERSGEIF